MQALVKKPGMIMRPKQLVVEGLLTTEMAVSLNLMSGQKLAEFVRMPEKQFENFLKRLSALVALDRDGLVEFCWKNIESTLIRAQSERRRFLGCLWRRKQDASRRGEILEFVIRANRVERTIASARAAKAKRTEYVPVEPPRKLDFANA